MKLSIITDKATVEYALSVISGEDVQISCIYLTDADKGTSVYRDLPVVALSELSISDVDSVVTAVVDHRKLRDYISDLLALPQSGGDKSIYVLRPSFIRRRMKIVFAADAEQEGFIRLPHSDEAIDILSRKLHNVVSPEEMASQTFTTKEDNINAYRIDELYVSFILTCRSKFLFGLTHTADGTMLNSCLNGLSERWYELEDVDIHENVLSNPGEDGNIITLEDVCVLTRMWTANYFHSMAEIVDKVLIAEELGFKGKYMLFRTTDIDKVLSYIGVDSDRLIWVDLKNCLNMAFRIKNAFDVEGCDILSRKTLPRLCSFYEELTQRVIAEHPQKEFPKRLFVPRIGTRKLLGVEKIIEKYGFFTFVPEEHTLEEEILYYHHADIALCPTGCGLFNTIFMRKGTSVIETCPCNFTASSASYLIIIAEKKLVYRQLVEPCNLNPKEQRGQLRPSYYVDNNMLEYTLDECLANMEKASELIDTKSVLQKTQEELVDVRDSLTISRDELASSRNELVDVKDSLLGAQNDLISSQNELLGVKDSLLDSQNELLGTKDVLKTTETELLSTKNVLRNTEAELQGTKDVLKTTEEELQDTRDVLKTTEEELQDTQDILKNTEEELLDTQNTLKETEQDLLTVRTSVSFGIGRFITFIPRAIFGLFRKKE